MVQGLFGFCEKKGLVFFLCGEYEVYIQSGLLGYITDYLSQPIASHVYGEHWNCKHLYYLYRYFCKMDTNEDQFIHAPSYSFYELKVLLVEQELLQFSNRHRCPFINTSFVLYSFTSVTIEMVYNTCNW